MTTAMRADPQSRLPRRTRRDFGIWRDVKRCWVLTLRAWRRRPVLFVASAFVWGAVRFACLRILHQAHADTFGRVSLGEAALLLALAIAADFGPLGLAACLWPVQHRAILGAPKPGRRAGAFRALRLFATLAAMALSAAATLGAYGLLPLIALPALGRVSTVLTLILLLPSVCIVLLCLLRLSCGLAAISLGLPRALAEGWEISRFHASRVLCVWLLAYLPCGAALAAWLALRPGAAGVAEAVVRPSLDVLLASVQGSLTGLLYRELRLAPPLRPDVRPSWNRSRRQEPRFS